VKVRRLGTCVRIYTAPDKEHMANIVCKCTVNLNNVDKRLLDVEPKIARKLIRKALTDVGKFWVPAVQSRVPVLEGDLKQSIHAVVRTRRASEKTAGLPTGSVKVGPCYGTPRSDGRHSFVPAIYGMWVEFGVKSKKYPSQPFLRPSFDATVNTVIELFAETLRSGLSDALKD
jgi:HK97 gp10 family phage protein